MIRVLVADDHPVVRAGLVALIDEESDLEVVAQAGDGRQAVDMVRALAPDVVLMDLRMPVLDGVAATAAIADASRVLVLTTYESDDQILAAIEAGAVGYLLKASPAEEILTGIRMAACGQSALSPSVAAALVRTARAQEPPVLTGRELEVLRLVASGSVNKEIARELGISATTVKTHLVHIFAKLEVTTRAQAVMKARDAGMI